MRWFAANARPLPWRTGPRDPYRVWISEVMAQQTRIEVVVPYFERFVARFPTLKALAAADPDEVLALWSGLGYYARARNLWRAARAVEELPRTFAELGALPGFGPYTAAAVASLAFGEQVAVVDGNVARVLARLFALEGDARARAWKIAPSLLVPGRAAEVNEALMELGATICKPRNPRCDDCPLARACAGRERPEAFGRPRPRPARLGLDWAALALRRSDGALLLARRGERELFAGLWDLPSADADPGCSARVAAGLVLRRHGFAAPARGFRPAPAGAIEQALTHRHITMRLFTARWRGPVPQHTRWVAPGALGRMGISSLAAKGVKLALARGDRSR